MKVDLFSIGRFTVHTYGVMIAIGVILCVLMGYYLSLIHISAELMSMSSHAMSRLRLMYRRKKWLQEQNKI